MKQTLEHPEPCHVQEIERDNSKTDYEDCKNHAHAHVFRSLLSFMLCFVLLLWILAFTMSSVLCSVSPRRHNALDHDVTGVVLNFTTHMQYQVQNSSPLDVVVRLCSVIVYSYLYPRSFEVISIHLAWNK